MWVLAAGKTGASFSKFGHLQHSGKHLAPNWTFQTNKLTSNCCGRQNEMSSWSHHQSSRQTRYLWLLVTVSIQTVTLCGQNIIREKWNHFRHLGTRNLLDTLQTDIRVSTLVQYVFVYRHHIRIRVCFSTSLVVSTHHWDLTFWMTSASTLISLFLHANLPLTQNF